jgi:hypothetical protein
MIAGWAQEASLNANKAVSTAFESALPFPGFVLQKIKIAVRYRKHG